MRQIFVSAFLALCWASVALAANEIERIPASGPSVFYNSDQLRQAVTDMASGDRLELTPGVEYVCDSGRVQTEATAKTNIIINGGFTCRVTHVSDYGGTNVGKLWYADNGDVPVVGNKIKFHGALPPPLTTTTQYWVSQVFPSGWFRVTEVEGTTEHVNLTGTVPANDLCYGYNHATIAPQATAKHHALLYLNGGSNITVQNITFDGQEKVSTGNGQLLEAFSVTGAMNVSGVFVKNCRGELDSKVANGIDINNCDEVNITNCFGENTGYCTYRTRNCGDIVYLFCRSINPLYRIIVDDTQSARTPFGTILLDSCVFKRTIPDTQIQQLGSTYTCLGNFNAKQAGRLASVTFDGCFTDWRDCEGAGNSWVWNSNSSHPILIKFEGIDNLTIRDSEFRHGKNNGSGKHARTWKIDNEAVTNLVIEDSIFSGGAYDNSTQTGERKSMTVKNSTFQEDGNFTDSSVFTNWSFERIYWQDVTVKNVLYKVFDLEYDWSDWKDGRELDWNFEGVTATTVASSGAVFFLMKSGTYDEPTIDEVNLGLYEGIKRGFCSTGVTVADNQWNGVSNTSEMQTSGSFFTRHDTAYHAGDHGQGILADEGYVGVAWVMYSADGTRFPPYYSSQNPADHFGLVRYDATAGWQWFDNVNWNTLTPADTDILVYKATYADVTGDNPVTTSAPDHLPNTFQSSNTFLKAPGSGGVWKFDVNPGTLIGDN